MSDNPLGLNNVVNQTAAPHEYVDCKFLHPYSCEWESFGIFVALIMQKSLQEH